ncbi:MAG: hypothetical protein ACE5O2_05235 [Armatimonadota bacterium]
METVLPDAVLTLARRVGGVADRLSLPCFAVGGLPRDLLLHESSAPLEEYAESTGDAGRASPACPQARRPPIRGKGGHQRTEAPARDLPSTSDIDIMVEGDGAAFAEALAAELRGEASAQPRFLTAKVRLRDGATLDVASAREEAYPRPGALPEVRHASAEGELRRRDFSINAMAIRLNSGSFGELVDPCRGADDVRAGLIRALHPQSFEDDPSRLWRAFRFAGRYGFRLEPETDRAAREAIAKGAIRTISGDRLGAELRLVLSEPVPLPALRLARDYGALAHLADGLDLTPADEARLRRASQVIADAATLGGQPEEDEWPPAWQLYAAALFLPLGPDAAEAVARALNFSASEARAIAAACDRATSACRALAEEAASRSQIWEHFECAPLLAPLLALTVAGDEGTLQRIRLYLRELRHIRADITGDDLIEAGYAPSPAFGRALRAALAAKLDGRAPDAASQLAVAKRAIAEQSPH